jgi:hypothetical protein
MTNGFQAFKRPEFEFAEGANSVQSFPTMRIALNELQNTDWAACFLIKR